MIDYWLWKCRTNLTPLRFEHAVHTDDFIKILQFESSDSLKRALDVHEVVAVGLEEVVELCEQPLEPDVWGHQLQRLLQYRPLFLAKNLNNEFQLRFCHRDLITFWYSDSMLVPKVPKNCQISARNILAHYKVYRASLSERHPLLDFLNLLTEFSVQSLIISVNKAWRSAKWESFWQSCYWPYWLIFIWQCQKRKI